MLLNQAILKSTVECTPKKLIAQIYDWQSKDDGRYIDSVEENEKEDYSDS